MTRIGTYARFSSDLQRITSIADQQRICNERVQRERGWSLVEEYADSALSGASMYRPDLQRMLKEAKERKFDVIVTEALDRISRNQSDLARIHETLSFHGVKIFTLHEGWVDTIHIGVKGMMGQMFLEDLKQRVLRGQRGRVEDGKVAAGCAYGYSVVKRFGADGKPVTGEREIVLEQAEIIIRIFEEYAAGRSPLKICQGLEADGILSPSGKKYWSVSTINGCRKKRRGILNSDLYQGKIVWNRTQDRREPGTNRRVPRVKPQSEWIEKDVPAFRIVPQELWDAVKARQEQLSQATASWQKKRPKALLSGLMRCGECGSPFIKNSVAHYACTRRHSEKVCTHRLTIKQDDIEGAIIKALQTKLMDDSLIKIFCEEYTRRLNQNRMDKTATIAGYEAELQKIERHRKRCVQAIMDGTPSSLFKDELIANEARKTEIEALVAEVDAPPVLMHPRMADHYHKQVKRLASAIHDPGMREPVLEAIRGLIDKVVLTPNHNQTALVVDLYGDLAGILCVADGQKEAATAARKARRMSPGAQKSAVQSQVTMAGAAGPGHDLSKQRRKVQVGAVSQVTMVGLAGLEPATRPL